MINKVIVQGNLVRDPELRQTKQGTDVCNFTIAMSEKFGDMENSLFLNCTAWKQNAKVIMDRFHKGDNVLIVGKLWTQQWTKDGVKHKENRLDVNEIHFTQFQSKTYEEQNNGFDVSAADFEGDGDPEFPF